jgi:ferredoxin
MIRKIIKIDEEKCNGCGLCINACHEGALQLVDGKAKLISDSYCDGLGNCLPECPTGAITIEEREAAGFDEAAVNAHLERSAVKTAAPAPTPAAPAQANCGCPGSRARVISRENNEKPLSANPQPQTGMAAARAESQLGQWPCQIKLVPVNAPYFENAHLLIAADCTAYAYANIHDDFMRGKITLIGCPKLDEVDYSHKLAQIIASHNIKSVTVLRMEVPCCGGIVNAVKSALIDSGKMIPWNIVTISTDGTIIDM